MIHPIPPGTRDVLPDEMRELRALISSRMRGAFERGGLRRGLDARARVRGRAAPRRRARRRRPLPAVRRAGRGAGAALRHDDPDRARGGHPLRATPSRRSGFCYFAHAYRAAERGAGRAARVPPGRDRADRRCPRPEGEAEVRGADGGRAGRGRPAPPPDRRRRRLAVPPLLDDARGARGAAPAAARGAVARATWWASRRRVAALGRPATRERELLVRLPELRGGPEVLDRAAGGGRAVEGLRALHELLGRARRGRPRDLRPRPRARARLLHRRGVRGLRPRRGLRARRRRPLRRPARALRPRRCPRAASRSTCSACTWRRPRRRRSA